MDLDLQGRVVVVTGAASGIGYAISEAFAAEGAKLVGGDLRPAALEQVGGDVLPVEVDLLADGGPARLVQAAVDAHGTVDVLVNCVGGPIHRTSFLDVSDEEWRQMLALNLLCTVATSRAAIPHMLEQGRGAIVSIASDAGRQPDPFFVDYCVAKAGVLSLSKALSIEYGPQGIRSNAVSPGPTRTKGFVDFFETSVAPSWGMTTEQSIEHFAKEVRQMPIGHVGEPSDVANVVLFLASDRAKQVTGAEYRVDGGVIRAA